MTSFRAGHSAIIQSEMSEYVEVLVGLVMLCNFNNYILCQSLIDFLVTNSTNKHRSSLEGQGPSVHTLIQKLVDYLPQVVRIFTLNNHYVATTASITSWVTLLKSRSGYMGHH